MYKVDKSILFFWSDKSYWTMVLISTYNIKWNDLNPMSKWPYKCGPTHKVPNGQNGLKVAISYTLYNAILRIARNFLETRENIKILTHPFYHINLGWFSWEWSKKIFIFLRKKNSKWPTQKKLIFQNRQFSKFFHENFSDGSLG